ncbi:phage portal protein [Desulfovibrio subterraneus]|uniref:phage portal protein n=1 Tax=Desulfovibrio subterraneus TaxID=2718620 RepID=UPI0022B8B4B1|nr:phage portal protein [Desulfovibrio subterraneus]WBF68269.1 phage portal protein [Desulfovibrio subterraneus]
MKKKKKHSIHQAPRSMASFSFGDPQPVLDGHQYMDSLGVYLVDNGTYYQTPVPFTGLARLLYANAYHGPLLEFKVLMVMRGFKASAAVARKDMDAVATDFTVFANAYMRLHRNGYGEVVRASHLPAINMRRLKEPGRYGLILENGQIHRFEEAEVFHFKNYDVAQTIYGKPRYLGAIQSMLLNEDATLFRRRYYKNGAHMGYVFYTSGADLEEEAQDRIQKAIEGTKGLGNFRNMYLHIPGGEAKAVQILPVGDFSSKDELEKIKNISRDDIIAAHRIPPIMANVIPTNTAGFGDIEKFDKVYEKNEIAPVRTLLKDVNAVLKPALHIDWELPEETEE